MRLDKYLKVSRIIKRRSVANEVCDSGRVTLNGRPAKASAKLKEGDVVGINFGRRHLELRVLQLLETVRADAAKEMYELLVDEKIAEEEDAELWDPPPQY